MAPLAHGGPEVTPHDRHVRTQHHDEQLAAFDREEAARLAAYLSDGGEMAVFNSSDHRHLKLLAAVIAELGMGESVRVTCGHPSGQYTRVYWSPRHPEQIRCAECAALPDPIDICDECGLLPAVAWREIPLPPARVDRGLEPGAPCAIRLRMCDPCFGEYDSPLPLQIHRGTP